MSDSSKRLKMLFEQSGMTYAELEKKTGIKRSTLQRYASGSTGKIPMTAIEKIAEAFCIPAARLMGWDGKKEEPIVNDRLSQEKLDLIERVKSMSDSELRKLDMLLRIVEAD